MNFICLFERFVYLFISKNILFLDEGRKEGRTSSQHDPYTLGYTHPTMAKNNGRQAGNGKRIP